MSSWAYPLYSAQHTGPSSMRAASGGVREGVTIAASAVVGSGVRIEGSTVSDKCVIGSNVIILNSHIWDGKSLLVQLLLHHVRID